MTWFSCKQHLYGPNNVSRGYWFTPAVSNTLFDYHTSGAWHTHTQPKHQMYLERYSRNGWLRYPLAEIWGLEWEREIWELKCSTTWIPCFKKDIKFPWDSGQIETCDPRRTTGPIQIVTVASRQEPPGHTTGHTTGPAAAEPSQQGRLAWAGPGTTS